MQRSTRLRKWQSVAIIAVDAMRGDAIMDDVVVFGKGWIVGAYLLHVGLRIS